MVKEGDIVGMNKLVLNQSSMCSIINEWLKCKFSNSFVTNVAADGYNFLITIKEKPDENH